MILTSGVLSEFSSKMADFLAKTDSSSYLGYHTPEHARILSTCLNDQQLWIYCENERRELVGLLLVRKKQGKYGEVLNSMPFFGANAGVVVNSGQFRQEIIKQLITEFKKISAGKEVLSTAFYTPFLDDFQFYEKLVGADEKLEKIALYLDLNQVYQWPSPRRGDVNRALRSGISIRTTEHEDINVLFEIYRQACENKGIDLKPTSYFEDTFRCAENDSGKTFLWLTANLGQKIVGGLLCVCSTKVASYTIPIADPQYRNLQPTALLIDYAIMHLKGRGVQYFNFEASPENKGPVYMYKKRWGALETHYMLLINYPNGPQMLKTISVEELKKEYPNYYITPFLK